MKTNKNAKPLTEIGAQARQGDTLLRRIESIPKEELKKLKTCTLALGEITNHHHTIEKGAIGYTKEGQLATYVEVQEALAALTHQEHETIEFPKGVYESLKQVEYTPQAIRNVAD